jgi:delta-aminolevulinic acid dehydratase/porphobilinogen synthase
VSLLGQVLESVLGMKRAGAEVVISYYTPLLLSMLKNKSGN